MSEPEYERYMHHGTDMAVRSDLKGRHAEFCLCHNCRHFKPYDREANCETANLIYCVNVSAEVVTPVWECGDFWPKFQRPIPLTPEG